MTSARLRSPLFALAALLALGLTSRSDAQSNNPVLPPTLIVTNYDSILIGQDQSLESGAYVARAADASANWYNPAGLANVDRSIISGVGTGYALSQLSARGSSKNGTSSTDLGQLPSYIGVVLGREVLGTSRDGAPLRRTDCSASRVAAPRPIRATSVLPRTTPGRGRSVATRPAHRFRLAALAGCCTS